MTSAKSFRLLPTIDRYADLIACLSLAFLTLLATWDLITDGTTIGKDSINQFYPWYSFLGESLRSGNIPGWNPSQFSGAPFAADPLSGWTYLPAMVLFTLLSVPLAAKSYLVFHLLLAGLGTYALARALRMNVAGAAVAAVAYEYTGYLYTRNVCCFAYTGVSSWVPVAILGAEMAIRSERWISRGLWWGLSGLALSQILAAWLGQGSYYALLALGGYIAYRTLLFPPENISGVWRRVPALLLNGGAVLLLGFGLAAAGILPRLEFNSLSNLADGYSKVEGATFQYGGWTFDTWKKLLTPGLIYMGLMPVALALAAPVISRGRHAVPFFAALALGSLVLAGQDITLLHSILYQLLPGFEWIHPHGPERIKVILYLGVAMLAGASVSDLREQRGAVVFLPIVIALFVISLVPAPPLPGGPPETLAEAMKAFDRPLIKSLGIGVSRFSLLALILACAYLLVHALSSSGRRLAAALLVVAIFFDMFSAGKMAIAEHATSGGDGHSKIDLAGYLEPSGAAEFLRSKTEDGPFRYFGYGPRLHDGLWDFHYNDTFFDPDRTALLASNQATTLGLQSIQGYNALHLARYGRFINALNGGPQGYHNTDVFPDGLDSPLLDLLGVRYIVVPAAVSQEQGHIRDLKETHPSVYSDDRVEILENRDAMPRAWIVHSTRQAEPGEALELLSSEEVDPSRTALLEDPPPPLAQPDDPSSDRASVSDYGPDRIEVETSTDSPGLLVLSEVYYPAWKAYIDGEPASVYRADQLLRGVPVPAGEHTVELRYESSSLRTGIVISLITTATLVALVVAGLWRWRRERSP